MKKIICVALIWASTQGIIVGGIAAYKIVAALAAGKPLTEVVLLWVAGGIIAALAIWLYCTIVKSAVQILYVILKDADYDNHPSIYPWERRTAIWYMGWRWFPKKQKPQRF